MLTRSLGRIQYEIRNRYLIACEPADFQGDRQYRAISLTVEKEGKQLQVRKGYT